MIKVRDNIFMFEEAKDLYQYFNINKGWTFTGGVDNSPYNKFSCQLSKDHKREAILFEKGEQLLQEFNLTGLKLIRAYGSATVSHMPQAMHVDEGVTEKDELYTVMFYIVPDWAFEYGGETLFVDLKGDVLKYVLPKPARALVVDGSILHGAKEVSSVCRELRVVVTLKYKRHA